MPDNQTTTLNQALWVETVAPDLRKFVTRTIEKWNAQADQFNQWSELGWDERDSLLKATILGRKILAVLDECRGFETGQIAKRVDPRGYSYNAKVSSGGVRSRLVQMQRAGLVGLLDDQKPVCWVRTPAGTLAYQKEATNDQ